MNCKYTTCPGGRTRSGWLKSALLGAALALFGTVQAQVDVNATGGTPFATYANLNGAFVAINAGTHTGDVTINITASVVEAGACVLNSSGSGSASYTSVLIRPTADGVTVSGATVAGRGLVELNGADNVTIDGDNPNTGGTNRNLTFANTAATATNYTSVIRVATATGNLTANDNTIRNCILNGSATGRNGGGFTSTTAAENTTFGIHVGPNGAVPPAAPTAITSVTGAMAASTTANNLLITNNVINSCARGVSALGATAASMSNLVITNNLIGDQATDNTASNPPYTSPATTVYTRGIVVQGLTGLTCTGNTVKNILSYVSTPRNGIELTTAVAGVVNISSNTIESVGQNGTGGNIVSGIVVSSATAGYTVSQNTVTNIRMLGSSSCQGLNLSHSGPSAIAERNTILKVINDNTATYGAYGINVLAGSNVAVRNNCVREVYNNQVAGTGGFGTTFGAYGIRVAAGTGHQIHHNTVHLAGVLPGSTSTNLVTCLVVLGTGQTGLDVRNNIFSNVMTGGNPAGFNSTHSCIYLPSGATVAMNLTLNNNAYYQGGEAWSTLAQVGITLGAGIYTAANFNPGATSPAANLRAYTSPLSAAGTNDNASFATTNPVPLASGCGVDVSLATAALPLFQTGANVGVAVDINGDPRGATPCIGADEFTLPNCASAIAGTISGTGTACQAASNVLSLSGQTQGPGISYQWAYGPVGGPHLSNLGTAASQNTNVIPAGSWEVVCTVTCAFCGPCSATTAPFAVTINAQPAVLVNPSSASYCGVTPVTLTASGASTYSWAPGAGLSATTGASVDATPAGNTTYTVTGTDGIGCTNTATAVILSSTNPVISASATPNPVCVGDNSQLLVTTPVPGAYCASTHASGCSGDQMANVVLNTLVNATGTTVCNSPTRYQYFAGSPTTTLTAGSTYTLSITFGPDGNQYFGAWIDYDNDGVLAASEVLGLSGNAGANGTIGVTFTVPLSATNGVRRLRIVGGNDAPVLATQACGASSSGWGETQDYDVTISGGLESYTFAWTPATYLSSTTIANPVATNVTTAETYTVTVTNAAGCSSTGNVALALLTDIPAAPTVSATPATVCPGGNSQLNASGAGPTLEITLTATATFQDEISWTLTNSLAQVIASGGPYFSSPNVISIPNPTGSPFTFFLETQGTWNDNATDYLIKCGGTTILSGSLAGGLTFTSAPLACAASYTYAWSPATFLSNASIANPVASGVTSTTTYTATITNASGCSANSTVTVTVDPNAIPQIASVTATPAVVCPGGNSDLNVALVAPPLSYCAATHTFGCGSGDEYISNVTFASINNSSTCAQNGPGQFTDYTSISTSVTAGGVLAVSVGNPNWFSGDLCRVYIDWNQNGVFDVPAEETILSGTTLFTGNINVPLSALNGSTRMRVRLTYTSGMAPCGVAQYGETEDYTVNVTGGASPSGFTFSWSPATYLNNTAIANPQATGVATATTYTVTVTDLNGCSNTGTVAVALETLDTDGDGTVDCLDGCPLDPNKIAPGQCGCGVPDTDTDGDGTADCNDGCPNDPNKIAPGQCGCGVPDTDTDGDGTADCNDGCPNDPNKVAPGICGCGVSDVDTDGDGTADCNDGCPLDPNKIAPGICGCGVADTDTDGDGTADCLDGCPLDPNKIAPGQCGCGIADTDTDGDGTADCIDACPNDPNKIAPGQCGCGVADTDTDGDGVADCIDSCPLVPGQIGSLCDDGDPLTINDQLDANCNCVGINVSCNDNPVVLTLNTDANGAETSWEIVPQGGGTPVCQGSGYASSSTIFADCCLPNNCYDLFVYDSAGDGMCCANGNGGWVLRNGANQRIIDNFGDGAFGSVAQSPNGFCVPIGTDALAPNSCDLETLISSSVLQVLDNPLVSGNYNPSNNITGYQYWIFNPDGAYSRRIFLSHQNPGSGNPSAPNPLKCSYLKISEVTPNPVPTFTLLNIRVRSRINGANTEFGPACRMRLDPTAGCTTTSLTTVANPVVSCGAINVALDGGPNANVYATPVALANRYQFEFTRPGYLRRAASPVNGITLSIWATNPLQCGQTYDVRVRISFDSGVTYCAWGPACQLSTVPCSPSAQGRDLANGNGMELTVYPNPTRDGQVFVKLTGLPEEEQTVSIEVLDLYGKRVAARTVQSSLLLNTDLDLGSDLASGMYTVSVTTTDGILTQRLVVSR
ncbi:MAG: T9SS type A sorting domain-containing protein [Flavobacteriales bacterium]|nr:T9SS type A sorting domain-containing protein [Flavobacteriales bacterium]